MNLNKHILFGVALAGVLLVTAGGLGYLVLEEREAAEESKNNVAALVQEYRKDRQRDSVSQTSTTTVAIYSMPSGARVAVDGDSIGTTPLIGVSLPTAPVVLSLDRPRHVPVDTLIVPGSSSDGSYTFNLRATGQPRTGGANSDTEGAAESDAPESGSERGADVSVAPDTDELSSSAGEPSDVGSSTETADPSAGPPPSSGAAPDPAGSAPRTSEDVTEAGSEESAPASTKLSVLVLPWGSIYIDGRLAAMDTDVTYATDVSPGRHRLRVSHPALGTMQRMIDVSGDSTHVVADFQRSAKLTVTSTPPGAAITVDGQATDFRTPTRLMLSPGSHEITVSAPGDGGQSSTRVVSVGQAAEDSLSVSFGSPQTVGDGP